MITFDALPSSLSLHSSRHTVTVSHHIETETQSLQQGPYHFADSMFFPPSLSHKPFPSHLGLCTLNQGCKQAPL